MMAHFLWTQWTWDPVILLGILALLASYLAATKFRLSGRSTVFFAGLAVLCLALVSPIDTLSDEYLFSAHMLQHLMLILIVAPLLLLGIPPELWNAIFRRRFLDQAERTLSKPALAWFLGMGTLWIWHWPSLYNLALENENVHTFEHLTFLVTAVIFFYPVLAQPAERRYLGSLGLIGYLFIGAAANSALGIILAFTPPGLYPQYLNPPDPYHILPVIQQQWGLDPTADQQLGGLLMWIPGGLAYLAFILATLGRWFHEPEEDALTNPVSKTS
jgi:cytochrome c oxidase assembly factor CtaG